MSFKTYLRGGLSCVLTSSTLLLCWTSRSGDWPAASEAVRFFEPAISTLLHLRYHSNPNAAKEMNGEAYAALQSQTRDDAEPRGLKQQDESQHKAAYKDWQINKSS